MRYLNAFVGLATAASAISVNVSGSGGIDASPLQYGLMFEDINHSGEGGLYAELIQNRAFQGDSLTPSTLDPWTAVGGANITLQSSSPALSSALPSSVNVAGEANTAIGISNPGFWGMEVKPQTYTGSFYAMGDYTGKFTASLVSSSGDNLAHANVASKSVSGSWTQHNFTLHPKHAASDSNNTFTLTFKPSNSSASVDFGLISLFPPTYKNRENGMRKDLMEALHGLNPSFLRLPGGNNLEGSNTATWWNWSATIGPLTDRPGRSGDWGYYNTDGLGLVEFMHWCQDLEMEPILALWSGMSLDGDSLSQAALAPYVTEAMNELEFLMGDSSTTWGAKRIALGYSEPFPIKYVEIGNEDNLNNGLETYNAYRFQMFYDAITPVYPDIEIIASTTAWTYQEGTSAGDDHEYNTPDINAGEFGRFDNVSTTHRWLVGEYASVQANLAKNTGTNWNMPFEPYPWWIGSVAEAIFELGAEKNADKIIGMSYAPLLENTDGHQWNPDMISFNADTSQTTLSTSWHQISLLSNTRMTQVLPLTNSEDYGPAYWVAGVNSDTSTYVFKAAVYNTTSDQAFTVSFPSVASGAAASLTVLTADDPYAMNTPGSANVVHSNTTAIKAHGAGFKFTLPQWSVAVLTAPAGGGGYPTKGGRRARSNGRATRA